MAMTIDVNEPRQMIVTLDNNAMVTDIKRAVRLMRGVLSIRMVRAKKTDNAITPALAKQIEKAREEYANGETVACNTPQEMLQYFESL